MLLHFLPVFTGYTNKWGVAIDEIERRKQKYYLVIGTPLNTHGWQGEEDRSDVKSVLVWRNGARGTTCFMHPFLPS